MDAVRLDSDVTWIHLQQRLLRTQDITNEHLLHHHDNPLAVDGAPTAREYRRTR